jgi:ATP-dependent HslUV protease subunit HslV
MEHSDLEPEEIVKEAMAIAADICIYTNHQIVVEVL